LSKNQIESDHTSAFLTFIFILLIAIAIDEIAKTQDIEVSDATNLEIDSSLTPRPQTLNTHSSSTQSSSESYESCTSGEAKSFAINRMSLNGTVASAEMRNMGNNKWGITGLVYTQYGNKTMMVVVKCNNGSYEVLDARVL
jgi:hypothetical protein